MARISIWEGFLLRNSQNYVNSQHSHVWKWFQRMKAVHFKAQWRLLSGWNVTSFPMGFKALVDQESTWHSWFLLRSRVRVSFMVRPWVSPCLPSGFYIQKNMENHHDPPFLMGKSTISMAVASIANCNSHYQAGVVSTSWFAELILERWWI